jgi:protein-tyrosine kinase
VGKIFKALEKSQQSVGNSENIEEKFETEPLPLFRDQENVHKTEIETRPVIIDPMLVTGLNPQSMESEQFRLLKNNILFPEKGTVPKCIMITSTAPGEGKSFVAANLAITLSQSMDEYVLLMDCDLRAPAIHSMFGYNNPHGLSEYLSKAKPLSSLLVNSFMDKLKVLPAGQIPDNPSELLSSEQMRRLIHEVKLRYSDRYIIIDTPPPSLTSETSAISRQVDGIVIVIKQGQTRKKDILNVIDIYGREKILGIVYNFAKNSIDCCYKPGMPVL